MKSRENDLITPHFGQATMAKARIYFRLTKPGVVQLIVVTVVVGMCLASPGLVPMDILIAGTLGIGLAASSAAAFNHVLDQRADALMSRTRERPLPTGQLTRQQSLCFALGLLIVSLAILIVFVNFLTAALTLLTVFGYTIVYTVYLKPRTPQNIVIGGAAGAAPPVLGWTAVTGSLSVDALILFLIIFLWTPPHFWALALYRCDEYAKAGIPMLPVTHGSEFTRLSILAYTIGLALVSLLPVMSGLSGILYLTGAVALNLRFIWLAERLRRQYSDALARQTFVFSIQYLALLFGLLWLDHYRHQIAALLH